MANVAVALTGNAQAARTTNSGADGVYTFADLPPGKYTLAVTPPAGFTVGAAGTASVTVAGGAQANASAFVLSRDTCALARPDFGVQRAVDVLRARPNVDAARIAYIGVSYGGAMGALFVGIERRIKAAALVVGDGGLVSHFTDPLGLTVASPPCATRVRADDPGGRVHPGDARPHARDARDAPDREGRGRRGVAILIVGQHSAHQPHGSPMRERPKGSTTESNVQLPVSVWFIGGLYEEAKPLRVAKAYQDATGRHLRYPSAFVLP